MANHIEILFPEDQQEGTEATVTHWLVKEGDSVDEHDPVVEIETDKVVVEVASPQSGVITHIKVQQDEEVNPGDVLCILDTNIEAARGPVATTSKDAPETEPVAIQTSSADVQVDNSRLSPAVRQRVMQHGLDVSGIAGSGSGGRITLHDVDILVTELNKQKKKTFQETPPQPEPAAKMEGSEIVPHDKMRKRIAESMLNSLVHTAPHVTAVFEADLSAVFAHRAVNKEAYASRGTPLTLTVYFIAATIAAIHKVPRMNSRWFDDHLEIFHHINIGIGTALGEQGLIVPVLKNAQKMDLAGIAAGLADLTSRARTGKLRPDDVRDGTYTISNHGVSGSLIAAPIIINQPESAILGIGKIEKRIKIREINGEDVITIRPMCYVSNTIDHRAIDGFQSNAFLTEFVSTLENWV